MPLGNYCRLVAMLAEAATHPAFLQELIGLTVGWSREFNSCYFVTFFYKLTIITAWFDIKRFSYLFITLRLVKRPVEFKREIFYWWMYTFRALDKERHLSDSSNYVFAGAALLNRQLPISDTHRISLSSSNNFALHSGNSSFESLAGERISWLKFFVVFLRSVRKILTSMLKLRNCCLLHILCKSLLAVHP